jgi:hypothetical protein
MEVKMAKKRFFGNKKDWVVSRKQARREWGTTVRNLAFEVGTDIFGKPKKRKRQKSRA